jgi:hypothetical protein
MIFCKKFPFCNSLFVCFLVGFLDKFSFLSIQNWLFVYINWSIFVIKSEFYFRGQNRPKIGLMKVHKTAVDIIAVFSE